jgi:hypothetical protein
MKCTAIDVGRLGAIVFFEMAFWLDCCSALPVGFISVRHQYNWQQISES